MRKKLKIKNYELKIREEEGRENEIQSIFFNFLFPSLIFNF